MKSTKKSLILSVVALLLCVTMLVGTTFAWFTDSVTSGVNTITAGNLDVDVLHTNAFVTAAESIQNKTNLFTDSTGAAMSWEPGAVSYENFTVENLGTLALKYSLALNITGYNAMSESGKSLKDALKVKVLTGDDVLSTVTRDAVAGLDWTADVQSLDGFAKENSTLLAGESDDFQVIVYWLPGDADNDFNLNNGKTSTDGKPLYIDFGIKVVATQVENETDSFGNDYDAALTLPVLSTATASMTGAATEALTINTTGAIQSATIPAAVANTVFADDELNTGIAAGADKTLDLSLNVENKGETTEGAQKVIDLEINLNAVMTSGSVSNTKKVEALTDYTTIEYKIGANKTGVVAKHNGNAMEALANAAATPTDEVNGGYYYDSTSGVLTLKTKTFSPFTVSFDLDNWLNHAATAYVTPVDTENKVITVSNAAELALFAKEIKADVANDFNASTERSNLSNAIKYAGRGYTVKLTNDIDLAGYLWTPMVFPMVGDDYDQLGLVFDGGNHTVTNLVVATDTDKVGFIGYLGTSTVKNLTVKGAEVSGMEFVGALVGHSLCGTMQNCHVKNAAVTSNIVDNDGANKTGVLCGYMDGTLIDGCTVADSTVSGYRYTGGLLGYANENETTAVTNNTVTNVKVTCVQTVNYKNYQTDAEYNANPIIGYACAGATVTGNTADAATVVSYVK